MPESSSSPLTGNVGAPGEIPGASPITWEAASSLRGTLHRYCARMVGSAIDGEDIVQDVMISVFRSPPKIRHAADLRRWLFRAAHHRSLDHLRRYDRRMGESLDAARDLSDGAESQPDRAAVQKDYVSEALTRYLSLAPAQRSCLILKEVFEYSLEEIAELLGLTVAAVKSAMARGRKSLESIPATKGSRPPFPGRPSPLLLRYCDLFNARDWDGLRRMLVSDVRLDLVSRWEKRGRENVSSYYGNYSGLAHCRLQPAWFEGQETLAFFDAAQLGGRPEYIINVQGTPSEVRYIRDFRHAKYILDDSDLVWLP